MEQFLAKPPNPLLSVTKDGIVNYSNKAAEPLLREWGIKVGERLPSSIGELVQRVISSNSPEKMDVKVKKKVYLVVFHPLPEKECVNISGFDMSEQIKLEGELQENEALEMLNLELSEIIDVPAIQSLMNEFYKLAHIPMSLDDLKGNVLVGVGWQDICTKFHRTNPETCKHCIESDTKLSKSISFGEFKLYKCKNNMWDIATPIIVGGQHVGNIFSGQFFFDNEPLDYELFRSQARQYGFDEEEYIAALEKVPRLSRETVNTGMAFLTKLANIISQLSYSNIKLSQSLAERDTLVDALRENSERLRQAQQVARTGTFEWDIQTGVNTWTPELEAMYGLPPGGFPGTEEAWEQLVYPEDRSEAIRQVNEAIDKGSFEGEWRVVWPDGSVHWLNGRGFVFKDESGKPLKLIGINIDITERKQEEHRVRRYNQILEGINWIFSNVVQAKTEEELGEACLSVALEVTGSEFGYIIEMHADGLLHDVAKSKLAWEQCHMYDKTGHICLPHDYVVHGLYGSVIINGKSFFTNDPQSHPDSAGLPAGHPSIKSFLTVPLTLDGKIVGSIGVGNREGGYSYEQQANLEAIAPTVTQVLQRRKAEQERKQFEEQIRQRAEEIETVMEVAPVAIFIGHDPKCQNITGNLMANELYKAKLGENVSANSSQVRRLFNKDIELTANELPMQKAALRDFDVRNEEIDLLLPSGEWRGLLGSASPLHDAEGNVRGSVGVFVDITERKKAEIKLEETLDNLENLVKERTSELEKAYSSLKESEKGLAEAQRMAHIGNWDWNLITGKVYWSDELYRIFRCSPQKPGATLDEFLNYVHPDDRERVHNAIKKGLNGEPITGNYRIVLASGEERIVHTEAEVFYNEKNNPLQVKGTVQDITEIKRVEEQIKILANIVESSNDAIGTISLDGIIESWNQEAEYVYGYSAEEILGKHVSILTPSHLNKETVKLIEEIKYGRKVQRYESLRLRKDGKLINISITISPVFDSYGKLIAVSFISRDVTERKEAEEALRNFEIARKKELHHRIKNNLQVISSLLDLQADLFKGRENIRDSEVLKAFKESIDRVISIALIHEELYKGKNIDLLNFSQYIKELAYNLLLTYSLKTDVSLNFELEENIFLEMDTAIPLGIVINEIVSNSLKYAFSGRDKGNIRIKLHRENNEECKKEGCKSKSYVLFVSDNGVGIPEDLEIEDLDSLGLQLVTTLVDQLDGELELKRSNGTKFIIRFTVKEI